MATLRRSNRRHGHKRKVNKHKFDYISAQIDESKAINHAMDQIADNMIFECKVDKDMLDQPGRVQISELKPDVASSWLDHKKSGSGVIGINPEVITIQVGQDVARKIVSCCENGWAVCILSAHGALSNVTLCQEASSRETVTYKGYFEMLSLCGSYQPSETDGMRSRTGGLTVSLAGPLGHIFCGGVAGPLIAASPVQVVIGRFLVDDKTKFKPAVTGGILGASSSTPGGASNGSSGPISPPN